MKLYDQLVLPRLIDWSCGLGAITEQRERIVPRARGRVLELAEMISNDRKQRKGK